MKNINLLSSLFFSVLVSAAPLKQRDYVTEHKVAVTTQVVFTTVWVEPGETAPARAQGEALTFHGGQFGYRPDSSSSSSSSTPAYTPPPVVAPTSPIQPPPVPQTTQQAVPPVSQYTPPPQPPASPSSASAPHASGGGNYGGGPAVGEKHTNVRLSAITQYSDGVSKIKTPGGCQKPVTPNGIAEHDAWMMDDDKDTSYVSLDGNVNWTAYCGKKIKITNGQTGKSTTALIVDVCPGCGSDSGAPYSLDLLKAPWNIVGSGDSHQPVDAKLGSSWEIIE